VARRKGKSRRRIKDWARRLRSGEEPEGQAPHRQRLGRRQVKLGQGSFAASPADPLTMQQARGMVVGFYPGGAIVRVGADDLLCGIAKTFRTPAEATAEASPLAVGDNVTVAVAKSPDDREAIDADRDRTDGVVLTRELRESALTRPRPMRGKRIDQYETEVFEKVIAANMDVLLIVAATCQPPLRHGLIDRFLIIAERGELAPVLVINKIDLAPPDEHVLADFEGMEFDVLGCSAATGEGLDVLTARLRGVRSVLAGASGVGKSTLINAIVPHADAATREVRGKNQRGRHTTSAAVVYDLPGGGIIVDTPGIRELGLRMDPAELPWYFPEFEPIAPDCKFGDCTHSHEPDCAVRRAVEAGDVPRRRYERYLRLLETIDLT